MTRHPDPESLAALAAGEPASPELHAHLAECAVCAADMGALRDLAANLGDLAPGSWSEPPDSVWLAVRAATARDGEAAGAIEGRPRTSRRRWIALGAAAAIGVAAGAVGGRLWWPGSAAPVVLATASLQTLDDHRSLGQASLLRTNGEVELSVSTEPLDPGPGYLEVWLLNTDGVRMVSLGILADRTEGVFPVSPELLQTGYLIVDISREAFDDKPAHSGVSLVRGELRL